MISAKFSCGVACLWLISVSAGAQERNAILPGEAKGAPILVVQKEQTQEKKSDKDKKEDKTAKPKIDFSEAPPQTAEAPPAPSFNMIGDPPPLLYELLFVNVASLAKVKISQTSSQTIDIPFNGKRAVRVAVAGGGPFKIADNESPLPQDRVFFTYNFYDNVHGPTQGSDRSTIVSQTVKLRGQDFDADIFIPGVATPRGDLHRETIGFEKTFLDGSFSLGMRVPFFQQTGASELSDSDLGNMTFIVKYAPYLDRQAGSGISTGLAVTVPTGPAVQTTHGDLHSTYLQPFLGYQMAMDRLLVFGFFSVAVPSEAEDVTLMFNDVGVGYRMFEGRGGMVTGIVPALEAHVTTPLNHRAVTDSVQGIDLVVLTGGVHVGLGERSMLTLGVATPVSGPRLFDVEAIVQFNLRF